MESSMLQEAIDRIKKMEECFDMLTIAEQNDPGSIMDNPTLKSCLCILSHYYENGQWLHDYELDEQGLLPKDLKRGVLSQDGVYNLLDAVKEMKEEQGNRRDSMKVLLFNGSPKANGNTARALEEMIQVFHAEGVETEVIQVGNQDIRGCLACTSCRKTGKCVIDDLVNECAAKLEECDGMVFASPVYFASANGTMISFLDRLFYSSTADLRMKVGASVAVARRGGCSATFDQLNKYFTICGMPVASSQYWNSVHGMVPGEADEDAEGLQTMRTLARNMIFLMKSIALGKEQFGLPEEEPRQRTNFIR